MTHPDEDALWRSIVENYGDRAKLDDDDHSAPPEPTLPDAAATSVEPFEPFEFSPDTEGLGAESTEEPAPEDEARFVPPIPGPLPSTTRRRQLAWFGVIGAPIFFLLTAFTGGALGGTIALTLIGVFVGSLV